MFLSKKMRFESMKSAKIIKYLAYSVGEVLLIVIGINIALHFDNRNNELQIQQELTKVYSTISNDLKMDTNDIAENILYFEEKEWIYDAILEQGATKELMDTSFVLRYAAILTRNLIFTDRGYNMLMKNAEFSSTQNDSLHALIVRYYDHVKGHIEGVTVLQIRRDADDNVDYWKFNHDWFHEFESSPEFIEYALNDKKYLNMVKKHHFLIYKNYLPDLKRTKENAVSLLRKLEQSMNKRTD